ncbi:MAG: LpqB family beta-propeller domain-containing protein, partial [Gemmatimonadota bacterium]
AALILAGLAACSVTDLGNEVATLHVEGRVTVDGEGLAGVRMELSGLGGGVQTATTNASGHYRFTASSSTPGGRVGFYGGGTREELPGANLCDLVDCDVTIFPYDHVDDLFPRHALRDEATAVVDFEGVTEGSEPAFTVDVVPQELHLDDDGAAEASVYITRRPDFTEEIDLELVAGAATLAGLDHAFTLADTDPEEHRLTIQDVELDPGAYPLEVEATSPSHTAAREIDLIVPDPEPTAVGRIAFVNQSEIYIVEPDGSGLTRLTDNDDLDFAPALSPDGSRIAFVSNRDGGNYDVYVMDPDGTDVTRLTTDDGVDSDPAWSPDGTRIVFTSDRDGVHTHLFVMSADGSDEPTQISDANMEHNSPSWSPDGSRIAFSSYADGYFDVFVVNADGSGGLTNLTNTTYVDFGPAWSPDGSKIAFTSTRGDDGEGNYDIYVMDADGSGVTRLTTHPDEDRYPAWSPDGTRIAFEAYRGGDATGIFIMNADGSDIVPVTDEATPGGSISPTWGPVP